MGFFNKKDEEKRMLPELPSISELPNLPPLPPLPSFPKNEFGNSGIGLQAIKTTVNEGFEKSPEYMPKEPEQKRTIEAPDKYTIKTVNSKMVSSEPVFIKLDKFKEAVEKFDEIKEKVLGIEGSLRKLKEIKEKEDSELKAWDEEMQLIRRKIEIIDNSLFNKI